MRQHSIKTALGVALLIGLPILALLPWAMQMPADAQTEPTATPTPASVHTESGCRFVANDLELVKAMYNHRGVAFPATPDRMSANFYDGDGNGVAYAWTIQQIAGAGGTFTASGTKTGAEGEAEYRLYFNYALKQARRNLLTMVKPAQWDVAFPLGYWGASHVFTHADWYMLDLGRVLNYDNPPHIKAGFTPVCYHLDTNPQVSDIATPTPTSTPDGG